VAERNDAIISIRPNYAEAILSGSKTIELRRRIPIIEVGTRLWIYATRPIGAVIGSAVIDGIVRDTPEALWNKFADSAGIGRADFDAYFEGAREAIGLLLVKAQRGRHIDIEQLRLMRSGFHPPQVIVRLTKSEADSLRELGRGKKVHKVRKK
jgi:predicted transcriptional regulator